MTRVRYAPSPTGSPHVGNIRTALFNYLMARRHGGKFIVRIEDTDKAREVQGALEDILASLRWLGIEWDEGPEVGGAFEPYFQSQRIERYKRYADELIEKGRAYKCVCTPEELEQMREYQRINKLPTGYNRRCRERDPQEIEKLISEGAPHVVRLAMPLEGKTAFVDAVRGRVEYENALIDDQVLLKSDGWPTYHLANVVDDHEQGITHVIRGEEWISSTPKHAVLYESFGWDVPVFAHAPVIKGPDGAKLSKRHGDTRCLDYREKGYLGGAVANFIVLIGWSPGGDREVMSLQEMAEAFSIEGIQPSPGVFDIQKLQWMNGMYIRAMQPSELLRAVTEFDETTSDEEYLKSPARQVFRDALQTEPENYIIGALMLEQERVRLLSEFPEACEFFFNEEYGFDKEGLAKWAERDHVPNLLDAVRAKFSESDHLSVEICEAAVNEVAASLGLEKRAEAIHPLRLALTGRTKGPGLFELMALLGPQRMSRRLRRASEFFARAAL